MSNQIFMNEKLTMRQKLIQLKRLVPTTWKRKEFKDFDYIDVQLTPNQLIWIHFITFFVSVICIAWGIMNEIDQDTFSNRNVRRY